MNRIIYSALGIGIVFQLSFGQSSFRKDYVLPIIIKRPKPELKVPVLDNFEERLSLFDFALNNIERAIDGRLERIRINHQPDKDPNIYIVYNWRLRRSEAELHVAVNDAQLMRFTYCYCPFANRE